MGFPVEQFVKPPHAEFVCGICNDVLSQPVETACGHLFCSECLSLWFQARQERLCPSCRAVVGQVKSARGEYRQLAFRCLPTVFAVLYKLVSRFLLSLLAVKRRSSAK